LKRFNNFGPNFWRSDLTSQIQTPIFNFQEYVMNVEKYCARVTRQWGWNRRDYSQRNTTEYFLFYRLITFKWAQAVLREHITTELNRLFLRLGLDSRIIVSGLPLPKDILRVRDDLTAGQIQFTEALNQVSI
jgi:hypothetical protein